MASIIRGECKAAPTKKKKKKRLLEANGINY
jgi:hypothetical protein